MFMDTTLRMEVRNCDLKIPKDKREFLCYPVESLVNCTIEETEDGIVFLFDQSSIDGKLFSCNSLLKSPKEEKLRFLMNCAKLLHLFDEYDCSLSPDNLLVDVNLIPKVLLRDARNSESRDFLSGYKALIGSFLVPKYSYEDFLEGGEDLFTKDKLLAEVEPLESVAEIEKRLLDEYNKVTEKLKNTKRLTSKKLMLAIKIALPLLGVCLGVAGFFLYQAYFQKIPYGESMVQAKNAYIAGQPLEVQRILRDYEIEEMSYPTKYILARSYVITEVLTVEQIDDVLRGLTLRTDEMIFHYWIHLGRLELESAIDIAHRFNDNELLLLAYLKYEVVVLGDPTIGGEERIPLLNRIQGTIDRLLEGREGALEQMLEEALLEAYEEESDQQEDELQEELGEEDLEEAQSAEEENQELEDNED